MTTPTIRTYPPVIEGTDWNDVISVLSDSGESDGQARINVKKAGTSVGVRRGLNLIEGSSITLTVTDDSGNEEVDVTVALAGTLTTTRINPRVQSVADAATVTPNADDDDCVDITAIAQAFTIANPSGTPVNFQKLIVRVKDNGTARAITWGNGYTAGGVSLPSTTVLSKILTLGFIYNTANSLNKWQCVASAQEA